jgi:hypothetical protein
MACVPDSSIILRDRFACHPEVRALARLEGWRLAPVAYPSRLAVKNGEHLRMT